MPPPGVSERDFAAALRAFERVVGAEWLFTAADDVALYRDAYSPLRGEADERVASAALAPATVEQVQEIVRIANRYRIPLYPISAGRNLAYGGSAPVLSGSVVLDLKRMNRVLEIDEENAYALVEPGVTYFDLYREIRRRNLRLLLDVPSPGWGSVLGNALERGVGLSPLGDHWGAHCGLEVVLADGSIVRTGMGALPNAATWQQYPYGFGPYVDGLFSQSNLGIVTKMGVWLLPEPEVVRGLRVSLPRHDDVVPLVAIIAELHYSRVIDSQLRIRSPVLHGRWWQPPESAGDDEDQFDALLAQPDGGDPDAWDDYARRRGIDSFWEVVFTFYGPEHVVGARWTHVIERFARLPGVRFADAPTYRFPLDDAARDRVPDKQLLGIPSLQDFGADAIAGTARADGHMDLAVVVPMNGRAVLTALKTLGPVIAASGGGVGAVTCFHPRTLTFISSFPTFRDDADANRRARDGYLRAARLAHELGFGQYRAHAAFMDEAAAAYSWGDHALQRLHARLKDALDPNGILAAGRYGIWPRHLRPRD